MHRLSHGRHMACDLCLCMHPASHDEYTTGACELPRLLGLHPCLHSLPFTFTSPLYAFLILFDAIMVLLFHWVPVYHVAPLSVHHPSFQSQHPMRGDTKGDHPAFSLVDLCRMVQVHYILCGRPFSCTQLLFKRSRLLLQIAESCRVSIQIA